MTINSYLTHQVLVPRLAIVLFGLFSVQISVTNAQQVETLETSLRAETTPEPLLPSEAVVPRTAHFFAPDGADIPVPPGIYAVEKTDDANLRLIPETGDPIVVAAQQTEHDEEVDDLLAVSEQVADDEFHVVLLLPDAIAIDAEATYSGITTRATRKRILRKERIRIANTRYKRVSASAASTTTNVQAATASPAKEANSQQYIAPGRTVSYRFEKAPEVNAHGARLVDPKSRRFIPSNIATASVKRGADRKRNTSGQYVQVPFVVVTVTTSKNFRYGDYQLWLLDRNGRPLTKAANQRTRRPARVAPMRVTSVAGNHPALQQQTTKTAATIDQAGRTQLSGQVMDPIRESNRANQVMDKLGQIGADGLPGLEPGSLAGSGLLLGFGEDLRAGFIDQLGEFPDGDFTGLLEGVAGGEGSGSIGGGRFQPTTGNPAKDSSLLQGDRPVGDSRIMAGGGSSGGGSSGGTFTIVSSSEDTMSSNGTQKVTDSINVTHDDGSSASHTMTSETHKDGSTTETQSASSTDKDGNTESESSTSTTDTEGNTTTTTTSTDKDGNKTTTTTKTKASDPASTPDPDGGDCTSAGCDEFMAFTDAFFGALAVNQIESQQTDSGSMMQPGVGTSTPGSFSQAELDRMSKERLNPYILHDNAGDSSIPMPAGSGTRPTFDVKESLTDPPRDGGTRPGGGMPIPRGAPTDAEESTDTDEEENPRD